MKSDDTVAVPHETEEKGWKSEVFFEEIARRDETIRKQRKRIEKLELEVRGYSLKRNAEKKTVSVNESLKNTGFTRRKLRKLRRDPWRYCADSRYSVVRMCRFFFKNK